MRSLSFDLPFAAAAALVAASFFSGVAIPVGTMAVRPEQLVPPLVLLLFLARPLGPFPRLGIPVGLWVALGLFSALAQPLPERAAVHTLRLLVTSLPVFLLPALLRTREEAERAWDLFLALVCAEAAVSLAALASHGIFGTSWGVFVERQLLFVHPMGTLLEPNLLGTVTAAGALALLLRLLSPLVAPARRGRAAVGALLLLAALGASLTRTAWLALPVGLLATLAVWGPGGPRSERAHRTSLRLALACGVLAATLAGTAAALRLPEQLEARTGVVSRLAMLLDPARDPNVQVRLRTYATALTLWREAPFAGMGHGAMERTAGTENRTLSWAGNLEVHLLADTGILGLALVLGFAAVVATRVLVAARHSVGEARRRQAERLGAIVVLLLCAQATETSWLGSFWVLFGLALAGLPRAVRPAGPLRVLYVHPSDELYGSDRVLLDLVRTLDRHQVEPLVVLSSDVPYAGRLRRRLQALGISVLQMRLGVLRRQVLTSPLRLLRYAADVAVSTARLARLLRAERIDLVHANTVTVFPAAFAARLAGCRLVWHVHEIVTDRPGRYFLHFMVAALADRLVVVSGAAREALAPFEARAAVVPNGVEPRADIPPPADPPVIAYVGRLSSRKGPEVLLDAAALLILKHPRARFVLAGDEFGGGDELRRELEQKARRLGLGGRVEFRPFREEIADVFTEASVVASPSVLPESFGLGLLEAMSFGRPVVASRLGGPAELVRDGETGFLVPPSEPIALAAALDRLLADPALARRLGEAGRRRSVESFSLAGQAAAFHRLYGELSAR
jgi:glycosyltransferase involved in cell wall biosynthesis